MRMGRNVLAISISYEVEGTKALAIRARVVPLPFTLVAA